MQSRFTEKARNALTLAEKAARRMHNGYIGTEHILLGLLLEGSGVAARVLNSNGVTAEQIENMIEELLTPEQSIMVKDREQYSPRANKVIEEAHGQAQRFHQEQTGTEHLLLALIKEGENVAVRLLNTLGIPIQKVYADVLSAIGEDPNLYKEDLSRKAARRKKGGSVLEQYSRDLTAQARDGKLDPVIGRDAEIQRVIQILSRRTKNNPCLVGEPGVGKTAVVEGLALRIVSGNVPATVQNKRLLTLDLSGMVAGSKYRGEFEERIKRVIGEVIEDGNIILFLDEVHTIIGAGGAEGAIDASNILKPSLARGEIQLIGATTIAEYRKYIEKDAALERRFQPVTVEEPNVEESIAILKGVAGRYEDHHRVKITEEAIEAAVRLSNRYINDRNLPDKAIDLIDEAASAVRLRTLKTPEKLNEMAAQIRELDLQIENALKTEAFTKASELKQEQDQLIRKYNRMEEKIHKDNEEKRYEVTEADIAEVVAMWTKIPVKKIAEKESERLLKLESILHKRVIGQEEAVTAVAKAMRRGRVGLQDPNRPIASFLFLGPTGVGKTELSKALAEAMFGSENALIRVDMSEYMERYSTSRLVGAAPGYVGYEEGGQLTEKVRRKPYSVVLLDEIEKAHPDVFNLLLQVLDDGRLTDSFGRCIDFRNTIIIMTSNMGSSLIRENFEKITPENKDEITEMTKRQVLDLLKQSIRPEFLNRIDETIMFTPLNEKEIEQIVAMQLKGIEKLLASNGVKLDITPAALAFVAKEGYDPQFGARPVKRIIHRYILNQLSKDLLAQKVDKSKPIVIDADENGLVFRN